MVNLVLSQLEMKDEKDVLFTSMYIRRMTVGHYEHYEQLKDNI